MVRGYGCTSVINAINLQFELSGYGLHTKIKRSKGGMWVVEADIKRPVITTPVVVPKDTVTGRPASLTWST